ncbi:hypothetical protein LWM68_18285 [Niabella sp. W65]|nr:hypothetical protein [Niabella sp. W65]MCH7364527.1 hypothetical protein [Niabella sp. W65]ULT40386.1 hypothetical protein KRR40_37170 [Niabella sp. I65]
MYSPSVNKGIRLGIAFFLMISIGTGCEPDTEDLDDPQNPGKTSGFIPGGNRKYIYSVESDGGAGGTVTQSVTGTRDSSGITVYNLKSVVEASGASMTLNNNLFVTGGKTYTEIKVPDAWYQYVALFNQIPNVRVTKAVVSGYPAYLVMDNALKDGSKITISGPQVQEQLIEYTSNGNQGSVKQEIVHITGTGKVETIKVPAGSFVCSRFSYEVATTITTRVGQTQETANGNEKITVWMAHGVGMVKQESEAALVSIIPLPTGEIKKVVTNTASTTTLQNIQ